MDHLITAEAEGLIPAELLQEGRKLVDRAVRVLNGYLIKVFEGEGGWIVTRD